MPTRDGAGVSLTRVIGQPSLRNLDPFIMLDEFRSDDAGAYIAGFPDHPHRGFETITVMYQGNMRHRDSTGNSGLITDGGIQWMTAGRGIIHSEMPEQTNGTMWGYQLWLNLPAKEKMRAQEYQDIQRTGIPVGRLKGDSHFRVVAGEVHGVKGAVRDRTTAPVLADVVLGESERFEVTLPKDHTAFVFVSEGELEMGRENTRVSKQQLAVTERGGTGLSLHALTPSRVLVVAGAPIGERIVQHGPFVMNSEEEIHQAIADYRSGRLAL